MKSRMAQMLFRAGNILRELQHPDLLAAGGCRTFGELLEKYELPAKPTAAKYIAVAESFEEPEAMRLGVDKGYAVVRYARLLGTPAPVLVAQNPRVGDKTLMDSGATAISRAIREIVAQRRVEAEADDDTAAETDKAVRRLGSRMRRAGAPTAELRRVRRGSRYLVRVELDPDEALALSAHISA